MTWRTGRKLGRTLYENDRVVGMVDTAEIAERIVRAMNAPERELRDCFACGHSAGAHAARSEHDPDDITDCGLCHCGRYMQAAP